MSRTADAQAAIADAIALLPAEGRRLVERARSGQPVRRTDGRSSVTGRFPSRKMGKTIQYESRILEGAACSLYEDEPAVLEFYDQPCQLKVPHKARDNRVMGVSYTPDFLVVRLENDDLDRTVTFTLVEWHPEEDLRKKLLKCPDRYEVTAQGQWLDRAVEGLTQSMGLQFAIRTERDVPAVLVRNIQMLSDYCVADPAMVNSKLRTNAIELVRAQPGITLESLLDQVPTLTIDDAFAVIAQRAVWVDLRVALLGDRAQVQLFETEQVARFVTSEPTSAVARGEVVLAAGQRLNWNGVEWTIAAAIGDLISFASTDGMAVSLRRTEIQRLVGAGEIVGSGSAPPSRNQLIIDLSPKSRERFERNIKAVEPYLSSADLPTDRSTRTLLRRYREAEAVLGDGVFGLAPGFRRCGRRGRRVDETTLRIAHEVIDDRLLQPEQMTLHTCYAVFVRRCKAEGVPVCSWRTFQKESQATVTRETYLRRRQGHRAAFAGAPKTPAGPDLPKDGDRAMERVHIDHTESDVQLVDSETHQPLGRPWLTIAKDAYSGRVLGHVLLMDPPSRVSVLLVLRDVIRRYQRFPHALVLDNGAEFKSTYLQRLAAAYEVRLEYRPAGAAKFGSPVERMFGLVDSHLVHVLRGNTQLAKRPRAATGEFDPQKRAVWTLASFDTLLEEYLYSTYDNRPDASYGLSPQQRFNQSIAETGARPSRLVAFDRAFLIATSPSTPKGTARISPQGVKIQSIRYWHPDFALPGVIGTNVEVRYDPLNRGIAYAKLRGDWRDCQSTYYAKLNGKSDREIASFSKSLRQRLRKREVTELDIVGQLDSTVERSERELLDARRAAEQRLLIERRGLGVVQSAAGDALTDEEKFPVLLRDELIDLERLDA